MSVLLILKSVFGFRIPCVLSDLVGGINFCHKLRAR